MQNGGAISAQQVQAVVVSDEGNIQALIKTIRGVQVILDRDVAGLYGVATGALNRQVKRNGERFPEDFMFRLSAEEWDNLKCQIGISSWGGDRQLPYAFTENGIAMLSSDILEWDIPEEVLAVLLKDRTTGQNLIWATDDYAGRGKGFVARDEIQIEQIIDKNNPVIRPRVDKAAEEQRKRVEKRAEVFTPSWICNRQNNLVDAAWFNWNKQDSSPFNMEVDKFDPEFRTIAENGGGHGQ